MAIACCEHPPHLGRPVLTSSEHHDGGAARFHLDTLGDRALLYRDEASL
jgi:hypothetical protein